MGPESDVSHPTTITISMETGLFHCPLCNQGFKQRSNAQSHMKSVHQNIRKPCPHCGKLFKKLKHHIADVHTNKQKIKCKICNKYYQEGRLFKDHMNKTHELDINGQSLKLRNTVVNCEVCEEEVIKSRFQRHMRLRHFLPLDYTVECPLCRVNVKYLPWHLQKIHKGVDYSKSLFRCTKCEHWFKDRNDYQDHINNHDTYNCKECSVPFDTHMELAKHLFVKHRKVFNLGKKYSKNITINSNIAQNNSALETSPNANMSSTYSLHKPENETSVESENDTFTSEVNSYFIDEESFTILVDEHGNLEQMITKNDLKIVTSKVSTTSAVDTDKMPPFLDDKDNRNQSDDLKSKTHSELEDIKEYQVAIDSSGSFLKIIVPKMLMEGKRSEPDQNGKILAYVQNDIENEFDNACNKDCNVDDKLYARFVKKKSDLPRSMVGLDLSPEDEIVLENAPKMEEISYKDLPKFQISKRDVDDPLLTNKYENCPSRQAHLCPYCRQVLMSRNALSRHISVIHLELKKFECDICGKKYATKSDVVKHNKAAHEESRNHLVTCDICQEQFKQSYIKRHKYYKHATKELPKTCQHCGKEFKTREIMLRHVRKIHSQSSKEM